MIRRVATALALVLAVSTLSAGASEPGRRRPVTNPQTTIEGVIASVSPEGFRVQTNTGSVSVSLTKGTQFERSGNVTPVPSLGDYTIVEGLVARDGSVAAKSVALFTVPSSVALGETVRFEGRIATVTPELSQLKLETTGGVILNVAINETTLIRRDGATIALTDIEAGSIARVIGKPTGERTLLALEIDLRTAGQPPHDDMVAGEVVEIRADQRAIVVRRPVHPPHLSSDDLVVIRTDEQSEIYRHREPIRFGDIKTGDYILAQGSFDASKALLASRIDVAELPEAPPKIAGRVLKVAAASRQFTVAVERGWMHDAPAGPVTVVVNDATKIYKDREQVRFDAIKEGDFVMVTGEWSAATLLVAARVQLVTPPDIPPMPTILGEITTIEPATKTLVVRVRAMRPLETSNDGTVKVLVGDDTKIFRNGEPIRFGDLAIGNVVIVVGELRDDKAILARRIDAVVPQPQPTDVMGTVAAVGEASVHVTVPTPFPPLAAVRVTILVDATTEIFRNGERVRLPAIKPNDMLFASGTWKDDSTFLARKIEVRAIVPLPGPTDVRGRIEAIEPGKLRVMSADGAWAVSVTRMTVILRGSMPVRFEKLQIGDMVEVKGMQSGDHAIVAMLVTVVP